jgi:hypothetical protein
VTLSETTELLAILKMAWPAHQLEIELGSAVYHRALSDIPYDLGNRAVDEWLRTGKFFPAPSEIRELALRAGVGLPAAEIAWQEAQRVTSGYRPGDAPPVWSSKVLEETVAGIGWGAIKMCDAENLGTLRAQFRDMYNALLKRTVADDAQAALDEAGDRRDMLDFLRRPKPEPLPIAGRKLTALPPASERKIPERYETFVGKRNRERFERRQAEKGIVPKKDVNTLPALKDTIGWQRLGPAYQEWLKARPGAPRELPEAKEADV